MALLEPLLDIPVCAGALAGRATWLGQTPMARRRPRPPEHLTWAEQRVLRLLPSDLSQREIGRALYLSQNTIKSHVREIYAKLGVHTRFDAITAARQRGLLH